jgi:hypothetical protein
MLLVLLFSVGCTPAAARRAFPDAGVPALGPRPARLRRQTHQTHQRLQRWVSTVTRFPVSRSRLRRISKLGRDLIAWSVRRLFPPPGQILASPYLCRPGKPLCTHIWIRVILNCHSSFHRVADIYFFPHAAADMTSSSPTRAAVGAALDRSTDDDAADQHSSPEASHGIDAPAAADLSSSLPLASEKYLPPLPPSEDVSILSPGMPLAVDDSDLLEQDVKRHLMDIESSFIPDSSFPGAAPGAKPGADDTYLFGGSPGRPDALAATPAQLRTGSPLKPSVEEPVTAHRDDPLEAEDEDESESENTTNLSDMPSSPAARARERSMNRTTGGNGKNILETSAGLASKLGLSQASQPSANTSSDLPGASDDEGPQLPVLSPDFGSEQGGIFASMAGESSRSDRESKRPSFLQNRQASQRSSVSSLAARSDISASTDNTIGADYALQSGGALPDSTGDYRQSLSRLSSMASLSSSLASSRDSIPTFSRTRSSTSATGVPLEYALGRLDEEEHSNPATPRGYGSLNAAPTDTVIAQHVQNIQVPETVAREYREKHSGTRSPERRHAIGLSYSSRTKANLTLKEQNSKIDKLSKENFDLKLKIHFLDQALQNRSDEGVKEMISKNVQLQTDLANEKKDNQILRRKVRELERKMKLQEEQATQSPSTASAEDTKSQDDDEKAEMEEEITYLREIVLQMETEMTRLRDENLNKELDKRRMADFVKAMGERRTTESETGMEETIVSCRRGCHPSCR